MSPSRHARGDIGKLDEPKAKALAMTTAGGHVDAYPHPGTGETPWRRCPNSAGGETPGMAVQHSGIFLGVDSDGRYRFLSSRSTPNGPSLGDSGGASIIDGSNEYWSIRFRTARRI
jgi:hypothetical protein